MGIGSTMPSGQKVRRFTSSPAFGGVTTLVIVLAGAAASLFTEGIRVNVWGIPDGDSRLGAVLFCLLAAAAVFLLFLNQRGLFRESDGAHVELTEALGRLDNAVKRLNTLPSEDFLPAYKDQYAEALAATTIVLLDPRTEVGDVERAIRAVLAALVDTAKDYDNANKDTVYAASVMLFRRNSTPCAIDGMQDLIKISPDSVDHAGVLELVPTLSTSSAARGGVDQETRPISLPIPCDTTDLFDHKTETDRSPVIPGAPAAYLHGSYEAFASIKILLNRLEDTSIDRKQVEAIRRYFVNGPGQHIRSFVSLPILPLGLQGSSARSKSPPGAAPRTDLSPTSALGVLNLHSVRPGLLADNGEHLFAPLMSTFAALVGILIVRRQELLAAPPAEPDADRQVQVSDENK